MYVYIYIYIYTYIHIHIYIYIHVLEVSVEASVLELKEAVACRWGVPGVCQRLVMSEDTIYDVLDEIRIQCNR